MSHHLELAMRDQEIERIGALCGVEQRAAAVKLALREAARQGCAPWLLQCIAVDGIDLTMRVVRDAEGQLQLSEIVNHETGWRLG